MRCVLDRGLYQKTVKIFHISLFCKVLVRETLGNRKWCPLRKVYVNVGTRGLSDTKVPVDLTDRVLNIQTKIGPVNVGRAVSQPVLYSVLSHGLLHAINNDAFQSKYLSCARKLPRPSRSPDVRRPKATV